MTPKNAASSVPNLTINTQAFNEAVHNMRRQFRAVGVAMDRMTEQMRERGLMHNGMVQNPSMDMNDARWTAVPQMEAVRDRYLSEIGYDTEAEIQGEILTAQHQDEYDAIVFGTGPGRLPNIPLEELRSAKFDVYEGDQCPCDGSFDMTIHGERDGDDVFLAESTMPADTIPPMEHYIMCEHGHKWKATTVHQIKENEVFLTVEGLIGGY